MSSKRILGCIASVVFVVALVLVLLFTNVQFAAFNRGYYSQQYEKYQIPQNIGISKPDLMNATEQLLNYMDGKRDNLDFEMPIKGVQQEFFSERDKLHMIDVQNLFVQGKLIRNISFLYCVLFAVWFYFKAENKQKRFSKLMIYTFVAGIIPVLLLAILMNIDFYKYFTIFHEIFFDNDLWQLYPSKDRLINMFPEAFFSDIAFKIVFYYIGELILLLVLGLFGLRAKRRSLNSK
ncbi:MAG TPA: TIGR01906 family membrane protein [Patescibacteria group bacterium]|nr:TIGR01906 family membrane protein [Patescibacteria group bacterium]